METELKKQNRIVGKLESISLVRSDREEYRAVMFWAIADCQDDPLARARLWLDQGKLVLKIVIIHETLETCYEGHSCMDEYKRLTHLLHDGDDDDDDDLELVPPRYFLMLSYIFECRSILYFCFNLSVLYF